MDNNKPFVNNVHRLPVTIVRAEGATVYDKEGRAYYDLWGDEGVASMGYGSSFTEALEDFIREEHPHRLPDMYHNDIRTQAAQMLADNLGYDRVFFCNSGAEVNEAMIKMARRYMAIIRKEPARKVIVTLEGNFHGRTGFALAASDSTDSPYHKEGYEPLAPGFGVITEAEVIAEAKQIQQLKETGVSSQVLPRFNLAPFIPNAKAERIDWFQVAAITMAPILGNNVVKTYSAEFWRSLALIREHHNILVLFDEVQVANGRTGYFAAYQHPDINFKPDIIGIGKGLALGLPAAALLTSDKVGEAFSPGVHFSTFGGTIIVCYMMLRLQKWLASIGLEHVRKMDHVIQSSFTERSWIKSYDGAGVHWGFTPDWKAMGSIDGFQFCERLRQYGVLMVTHRPKGCIRFTPPLNITRLELSRIFDAMDQTANSFISPP